MRIGAPVHRPVPQFPHLWVKEWLGLDFPQANHTPKAEWVADSATFLLPRASVAPPMPPVSGSLTSSKGSCLGAPEETARAFPAQEGWQEYFRVGSSEGRQLLKASRGWLTLPDRGGLTSSRTRPCAPPLPAAGLSGCCTVLTTSDLVGVTSELCPICSLPL